MKVKVSDATEVALNWMVASIQLGENIKYCRASFGTLVFHDPGDHREILSYTTNWAQGGPIIEREEIGIRRNAPCMPDRKWEASPSITAKGAGGKFGYGPTPLIAAMRCYVASKLGYEVEVPEELL